MTARAAFVAASFVFAFATVSCGPKAPAAPPPPPPVPLHLSPACDLAASAGLEWIVDARPRSIAEIADLIPAIAQVVPEARFAAFSASHGGIDVRQVTDLCVAHYRESTLTIARTAFDPARVEQAFAERVTRPGGRALDVPNPPVVRLWGEVTGEPEQLVLFGREAIAFAQGRAGSVRVAEAFALGKLKRATPALKGAALARAAELLGDAPVRVFAPGPFEGEAAQGLAGLMRASTSVAVSASLTGPPSRLAVTLVLTGAWGKDADAAAERLRAAAHVVAESPLGRLLALDRPLGEARVRGMADALVLETTVDPMALARGVHDALDAEIADILRR